MVKTPLPMLKACDDPVPCGACCREQAALPVSSYFGYFGDDPRIDDPANLPPELRAELEALLAHYKETDEWPRTFDPCIWYDAETRKCKHYEHRPKLCHTGVVVGDEACLRWRRAYRIEPTVRYTMKKGKVERHAAT